MVRKEIPTNLLDVEVIERDYPKPQVPSTTPVQ